MMKQAAVFHLEEKSEGMLLAGLSPEILTRFRVFTKAEVLLISSKLCLSIE